MCSRVVSSTVKSMAELSWKSINDFTPGVRAFLSPNNPPGSADPDRTFGCWASPSKSLTALPRVTTIAPPMRFTGGTLPDVDATLTEQFRITGLHVRAPLFGGAALNSLGADQSNDEILMSIQYWTNIPGDNDRYNMNLFRYRHNWENPRWDRINARSRDLPAFRTDDSWDNAFFSTQRSNSADPAVVGTLVTVFCDSSGTVFSHPGDTTPSSDTVDYLKNDYLTDPEVSTFGLIGAVRIHHHQGRLVTFPLYIQAVGTQSVWVSNEQFFWSPPNDVTTRDPLLAGAFSYSPQYTDPVGYHVAASVTADEFLLIKSVGGGIILRGDLNDATVVNYPYVRSTGFTRNNGTPSPIGYLYPVDGSGVWAWTGGQVSEFLTVHLDDDFWRPPTVDIAGDDMDIIMYPTGCGQFGDWAMFPNNYMLDTSTGGWWRTDDPNEFIIHRWHQNYRGTVCFGAPSGFRSAADPAVYVYDRTAIPRSTFTWGSHPMVESLERETVLSEVVVVASGVGDVTLTATTGENPAGVTVTFPIDGSTRYPQYIRQRVPISGTQLTFDVTSTAASDDLEAPTIHEIRYGLTPSPGNLIPTQ